MFGASLILTPAQQESGGIKIVGVMRAANTQSLAMPFPAQVTNAAKIAVEERERSTAAAEFPACAHDEPRQTNRSWSLPHLCAFVFGVSFIVFASFASLVLFVMFVDGRINDIGVGHAGENVRVARSLAANGTFADPFVTHAHRTHGPRRAGLSLPVFIGSARLWHRRRGRAGLMGLERRVAGAANGPAAVALLSPRIRRASGPDRRGARLHLNGIAEWTRGGNVSSPEPC